jgi:hypothetical protein
MQHGLPLFQSDHVLGGLASRHKMLALLWVAANRYNIDGIDSFMKQATMDYGALWDQSKRAQYHAAVFRHRKRFVSVCRDMELRMSDCLDYYYCVYKVSKDYRLLKTILHAESNDVSDDGEFGVDSCGVCGDGGNLLICDNCDGEYHMECMRPALAKVPKGRWECDECIDKSFLRAREHWLQQCLTKKVLHKMPRTDVNQDENDDHLMRNSIDPDHDEVDLSLSTDDSWQPTEKIRLALQKMVSTIGFALSPDLKDPQETRIASLNAVIS